jgi:hypothetical protein
MKFSLFFTGKRGHHKLLELETQLHLVDIAEAEVNEKVRMRMEWMDTCECECEGNKRCCPNRSNDRQCRYLMEKEPMFAAVRK